MSDEQSLHDIGGGRLSELKENSKALLVGIYARGQDKPVCENSLVELQSLCDTYGIEAEKLMCCPLKKIESSTFLGKGKVEEIAKYCEENQMDVVIFDDEILPHQQRNLESFIKKLVIDRTELILGVFLKNARTKEAKLQISLALYKYQMPRLKRMWTHLSRQHFSSGGGYLKGVGEKQIEIDRRLLRDKIVSLEKKIDEVKKQWEIQRAQRVRSMIPSFAIIGYTNVGKSTLLNALTSANVLVENKLFATLDTTTRKFVLPNRQEIVLIDTVGFIRKLPHTLVAAFRSTLEEATSADILLHLIDVSDPHVEEKTIASIKVLEQINKGEPKPIITVLNKVDNCSDPALLMRLKIQYPKTVQISALNKQGFDDLIRLMLNEISLLRKIVKLKIPQSHYHIVSMVMKEGKIISQEYVDNDILIEAEIPKSLEIKVSDFLVF